VIIPLWTLILEDAVRRVQTVIPRARDFIFKLAAKLLGVMIGPLAHEVAWDSPFLKYVERIPRIKTLGLGFFNTISLHNTHIFSVLSHVMQFHTFNAKTAKLEREAHQRLLSAPRFTYTTAFLAQAKAVHLPQNLHTLPVQGLAAQYRFATSTSHVYRHCEQLLRDTIRCSAGDELGTEYHLTPLCSDWWKTSIMAQLCHTVGYAYTLSPQLTTKTPTKQLQRHLADIFVQHSDYEKPLQLINRRLLRFLSLDTISSLSVDRTLTTLSSVKHPFLVATVIKTWLNGWCTSKRFQLTTLPCFFGCGQDGGDLLEHYRCCPIIWNFYRQQAPLLYEDFHVRHDNFSDSSTKVFMALHAPPDLHHTLMAAVLLHAVFTTYETLRSHQANTRVNDYTNKHNLLTNKLHFTLTNYKDLHDHFVMWNNNPSAPRRPPTMRP